MPKVKIVKIFKMSWYWEGEHISPMETRIIQKKLSKNINVEKYDMTQLKNKDYIKANNGSYG